MRQESEHLGGSCEGVSNKTKFVPCLNVIGQEFQCKQSRFSSRMPLHTTIFKRAGPSQKAKYG
jgi:hypothetical protein